MAMDPSISDPPILHPPMMPGAVAAPRSAWPSVIGVIAIVFGALGALQGVVGLLAPMFVGRFRAFAASNSPQGATGDPFAGWDQHQTELIVSALLTLGAGTLLLVGSILLVMRKRASRGVLLLWAAIKMAVVVFGAWLGYVMNQAQFAAMQQSGSGPLAGAGMGGMLDAMSAAGAVIGVLWGWALPIFMLIWFMRAKVRNELATW
jgi:hypothetical protein